MAFGWELITLVAGTAYGYFKEGRQDKGEIFKAGLMWGLVIAAVLAVIGILLGAGLFGGAFGFVAMALSFVLLVALFVGGVFIGDWLEHR